MKSGLIWLIVILVVIGGGWLLFASGDDMENDDAIEIGDAVQPDFGVPDVGVKQEATLEAVGSYTGSGTAVSTYIGGVYSHSVSADIGDPADGKFYEGWIVRKVPFKFISTGKMVKDGSGYSLEFTSEDDHTGFTGIVITEETEANGLDNKPEAHVLEGDF